MASKYTRSQEFGEIFNDSFKLKCSFWKVCRLSACNFYKESPLLFFSNATWILKLYGSFQMSQSNNPSFDVVLERLYSETQDHYVILHLDVNHSIKIDGSGSFFFNVHHAHKNVITLKLKEKAIPGCLHFNINVYVKTNDKTEDFSKPSSGEFSIKIPSIDTSAILVNNIFFSYLANELSFSLQIITLCILLLLEISFS